jgi:hypothetical protein
VLVYDRLEACPTKPAQGGILIAMNTNIYNKIGRFVVLVLLGVGICHCISNVKAAERPNVVVILTDDQGWGDLSASGNTNLKTPNVDSLARNGASFDRFFVCPVCSPTRAEFLTGR